MTRLALLGAAALLLASCGRQGDLARPGPLFGRGGDLPPQTADGPAAASDADGDAVDGTGTRNSTPIDPSRSMRPATNNPIEGTTDPIGDRPPVERP